MLNSSPIQTSSFPHITKTPQTQSPNAKASHSSRSQSPPSSRTSFHSSPTTRRTCPPRTPRPQRKNRKRVKRASAHSPENVGISFKQSTPNIARRSYAAWPPRKPLRLTKSNVHSTAPHPPVSHRSRCRNRSRNRFPPDACFLRGTCLQIRTKPHCARASLHYLLMLPRLIILTIPRASIACVSLFLSLIELDIVGSVICA